MKTFFLPVLMVATVSLVQTAAAGPGAGGNETPPNSSETASTVKSNGPVTVPEAAWGQTTEGIKDLAGLKEAQSLHNSENGQNPASQVGPYDFGAKTKLEAMGPGELCIGGECYKDRAYADYCKATFANCPLPAGSELAPKTPAAPASNVK